jgi:autophagy-related protein 18
MLFTTSLVALVSSKDDPRGSPRQLRLFNAKRDPHVLKELDFASAILAVRMNRSRLVVVLERRILVHDIKTLKVGAGLVAPCESVALVDQTGLRAQSLTRINTAANPLGVCALSANHGNCLLAFPASAEKGDIVIYDAANLQVGRRARARILAFSLCLTRLLSGALRDSGPPEPRSLRGVQRRRDAFSDHV